ncbi:molybdopterin molybdotransferase MoeA, partial [Thermodesulfobacteriota bacterium]
MKEFFKVKALQEVLEYASLFSRVESETVSLKESPGRVLAADMIPYEDLPNFCRSTMDGYAVCAASTYGASEANPAYLTIRGSVVMGEKPDFSVGRGEAARISTGGMLPDGSDSVLMIEHTETIDDTTIEAYRSVAPGRHVIQKGEDIRKGEAILLRGRKLKAAETGLLAAFGKTTVDVYRKPIIGILSTGDEISPVESVPDPGKIRDINTYTLFAKILDTGGVPLSFGIIRDDFDALYQACKSALEQTDMVLLSGGSSVGVRDFTIEALSALPESEILVHGISISPGKPTILARAGVKAIWGL